MRFLVSIAILAMMSMPSWCVLTRKSWEFPAQFNATRDISVVATTGDQFRVVLTTASAINPALVVSLLSDNEHHIGNFSKSFDLATGLLERFVLSKELAGGIPGVKMDCPTGARFVQLFYGPDFCSMFRHGDLPPFVKFDL